MKLDSFDESYYFSDGLVKFELVGFHALNLVPQSVDEAHQQIELRLAVIVLPHLCCCHLELKSVGSQIFVCTFDLFIIFVIFMLNLFNFMFECA